MMIFQLCQGTKEIASVWQLLCVIKFLEGADLSTVNNHLDVSGDLILLCHFQLCWRPWFSTKSYYRHYSHLEGLVERYAGIMSFEDCLTKSVGSSWCLSHHVTEYSKLSNIQTLNVNDVIIVCWWQGRPKVSDGEGCHETRDDSWRTEGVRHCPGCYPSQTVQFTTTTVYDLNHIVHVHI